MSDEPVQTFASVWDALEETPEEAANMRLRSELAIRVRTTVEEWGLTQAQAARRADERLRDLTASYSRPQAPLVRAAPAPGRVRPPLTPDLPVVQPPRGPRR